MSKRGSVAWRLVKETYSEWSRDNALRLGAALSYYTVFSLPPLLFLAVGIAGILFGEEAARGHLVGEVRVRIGVPAAEAIRTILEHSGGSASGVAATIVGLFLLAVGATAVFGELQDDLNTIWGIREKPGRAVFSLLRSRIHSFVIVVGIGIFLLAFLALSTLAAAFKEMLTARLAVPPQFARLFHALDFLVSFSIITVVFAMIYKVLPYAKIAWRDVALGAAATSLLFTIGKLFVGMYLGGSGIVSAYRAAGSLIVLIVWIYFSAQVLLLGAEFTQVYARYRGREIEPAENAEWIRKPPPGQGGIDRSREDSAA
jgi:membrane protein